MKELIRRLSWGEKNRPDVEKLSSLEWLVTNGLGGYASGTVAGIISRRYHGLLIAALPPPLGRIVAISQLIEQVYFPNGQDVPLGGLERTGEPLPVRGVSHLVEFRLELGLPVWRYDVDGIVLEKSILLVHQQNTTHVNYRLLAAPASVRLGARPVLHFRCHDAPVDTALPENLQFHAMQERYETSAAPPWPVLRMQCHGRRPAFTHEPHTWTQVLYRVEQARGYDSEGDLWSPGQFHVDLSMQESATFVISTEPWEIIEALGPHEAANAERKRRERLLAQSDPSTHPDLVDHLVLAADQFVIRPVGPREDPAVLGAAADEMRSVIAGYPWFTDWGRDTMISLEGLALLTGRHAEAGRILRSFAHYFRDGLLPNLFPEGQRQGAYHTADATLWFFHALSRYLAYTNDRATLELLLPQLQQVVDHHLRGTRFGIGLDPADGLLRQGADGYQLTWMDAKVGDWVVTPRRGKAVEINALWYNALRLMNGWLGELDGRQAAQPLAELAEHAAASFNKRFWNSETGFLFDVVDGPQGDDPACRPNQIFAFTLAHPVLDRQRWQPVLEVVTRELWTPLGLRTLSPRHPDFRPRYEGDLRTRDAAYHQGTVWAWLVGPFVDARLRVHPQDRVGARRCLQAFDAHLDEACIGAISEIFDAEPPYTPRGCVAQAWSVAEVLRAYMKTSDPATHAPPNHAAARARRD